MIIFLINFFLIFSTLNATLSLANLEHGWAYLINVQNQTTYPATLSFAKDIGPFEVPAGGILGEDIEDKDGGIGETIGDMLAPISAIRKTRIWENGKDLTGGRDSKLDKVPKITGAGIKEINNFDAMQLLMLQPMNNSAIAWLAQQDLTNPKKPILDLTLSFLVYVRDEGNLQVILSDSEELGSSWNWKIVFSSDAAASANVVTKTSQGAEKIVAYASNIDFPKARIIPGKMNKFWISFKGNRIVIGYGKEGENPFLTWTDEGANKKMKRLGFSCGSTPVTVARIATFSAVFPQALGEPLKFFASGTLPNNQLDLREPGQGGIIWQGSTTQSLEIFSKENPQEKILLNFANESLTIVQNNNQGKSSSNKFMIDPTNNNFWLAIDDGQLIVGQGIPAVNNLRIFDENPNSKNASICAMLKSDFLQDASGIQFNSSQGGIYFFSRIKISALSWQGANNSQPLFSGKIQIYQPYNFEFSQSGPVINGKDLITNKTYLLGKAPEQGAIYPFTLTVKADGTPAMAWKKKPVNVGKFFVNTAAISLRLTEAKMYGKAMDMTNKDTDYMEEDLAVTDAVITTNLTGAAIGAVASLMEATNDLAFRDSDAFGFTEQVKKTLATKDAEKNTTEQAKLISLQIEKAKILKLNIRDDLDYAFQLYADVIANVKDSAVLTDNQRQQITIQLKNIAEAANILYKNPKMVINKVARLFTASLNNPYFFNRNNFAHKQFADSMNETLQKLFEQVFFELGTDKLFLPQTNGQFIWTGKTLNQEGSIFFRVKSPSEFLIQLVKAPENLAPGKLGELTWLEPGSALYEIELGSERNTSSSIKISHFGKPVQKFLTKKKPSTALSSLKSTPFWVSLSGGRLALGQGEWGEGKFLEWTDPFPQKGNFLIGFAVKNSTAEIESLRVGPPVERLDKTIITGKTEDEIAREKKLAVKKAESKLSELDQKNIDKLAKIKNPLDVNLLESHDPFKYDELAMLDSEIKYGSPLEWSDLDMAQYQRERSEENVIQTFYDKQAPEKKDEDAEREKKQAEMLAKSQEAKANRESRAGLQKQDASGFAGVKSEFQQANMLKGGQIFKQQSNLLKDEITDIKRQFKIATGTQDDKQKKFAQDEAQGNTEAEARREQGQALSAKQSRIQDLQQNKNEAKKSKQATEAANLRKTAEAIASRQEATAQDLPARTTEDQKANDLAEEQAKNEFKENKLRESEDSNSEDPFAYENIDKSKYQMAGTLSDRAAEARNSAKKQAIDDINDYKKQSAELEELKQKLAQQPEDQKDPKLLADLAEKQKAVDEAKSKQDKALENAKQAYFGQFSAGMNEQHTQSERSEITADARIKVFDAEQELTRLKNSGADPEQIKQQEAIIATAQANIKKSLQYTDQEATIIQQRDKAADEVADKKNEIDKLETMSNRTPEDDARLAQLYSELASSENELNKLSKKVAEFDDKYSSPGKETLKMLGGSLGMGLISGAVSGAASQSNQEEQSLTSAAEQDAKSKLRRLSSDFNLDKN